MMYPQCAANLDLFADEVLEGGLQLDPNTHPGFADHEFRKRRQEFVDIALNYKHGQKIPEVTYTADETALWSEMFRQLRQLYPTHACRQYNEMLSVLLDEGLYREDNIPQLQDVSDFLEARTGFTLRPVGGLISSRSFLAGLAFRVFHATHDVIHELLGHAVMFADQKFADFSQEIGLASLGASDDIIQRLETCYRLTVEYGLCRDCDDLLRAYGAALLSSPAELQYCLSDEPQVMEFDPVEASLLRNSTNEIQSVYYVADSFEQSQAQMKEFALRLDRQFSVLYNVGTKSVEILDKN